MSYLLDTNVISELKRPKPNECVVDWFATAKNESLYLSVLTLGEIRKGIEKLPDGQKKQVLSGWLERELTLWFGSRLLAIDTDVADCWGRLQAQANRPLPAVIAYWRQRLCIITCV